MEIPGLFYFRLTVLCCFLLEPVISIWLATPESVIIISGHPLVIDCNISDYNGEQVLWKTDYWNGNYRDHGFQQEMLDGDNNVKILRLTKDEAESDDSTLYRCLVDGSLDEKNVFAAISTVVTSGANVSEGFDANLKCKPTPGVDERIQWQKDGVPVDQIPSLKDRVSLDESNVTLTVKNAKLSDAGTYNCEIHIPDNHFTMQTVTEQVVLQGKPYMVKTVSPDEIFSTTDKSLILKCPVQGTPHPEVFWQRGEDVLEASAKYTFKDVDGMTSVHLEISEPTKEDYGEYMCTADNVMGKMDVTLDVVNSTLVEIPGGKPQANSGQGDRDAAQALWQPTTQFLCFLIVTIPMTLFKFR